MPTQLVNSHEQISPPPDSTYAPIAKGVTNGDSHDHVGGDGAALKYSNIIGGNGVATTVPASTTTNLTLFASGFIATGANAPISKAGTLKNLYIRISGAQPASGNMVFDVMINNSTSGITCTLAAGAGGAGLTLSDTTHTAAVSIGDLIRVQTVNNATGASAPVGVWMMELETTTT